MKERMFVSIAVALSIILGLITTVLVLTHEEEEERFNLGPGCTRSVLSRTAVNIDFGYIDQSPRPTNLTITLERNDTHSGQYEFVSDEDGPLALVNGENMGTIHYVDLADNEKVNVGDMLKLTGLYPDSYYELVLSYASTGDVIMTCSFSTPP